MLERDIVKAIRKMVNDEFGGISEKLHGSPYQNAGLPDLAVLVQGRWLWLEVKRLGGKVTEIQKHLHEKWRGHGATVAVVYSVEEARSVITQTLAAERGRPSEASLPHATKAPALSLPYFYGRKP